MYESMNEVYKILTPIAEAHRDYKKLANIHRYELIRFKEYLFENLNFFIGLLAVNSTTLLLASINNKERECLGPTSVSDFMVQNSVIWMEKSSFIRSLLSLNYLKYHIA